MRLLSALFLTGILALGLLPETSSAQGCVAIRHFSTGGGTDLNGALLNPGELTIGTSYRYFESFRHFSGREEHPDRVANNTEVINYSHSVDFYLSYALTNRLYSTLTLPVVLNTRSSLYEHGRTDRFSSFSRGMADARVGVGYWLLNPAKHHHYNAALAVGIKLPTGNQNASDIFYNVGIEGHPEVRPVDQSIQPGDGGFGFTIDAQIYHHINDLFSWYGSAFYLFNPREMNGVRTFRETLSPILANESIMSVPDQFAFRAGAGYSLPLEGVSLSLGARYEGVPVEDLIGGSAGFRRPGSVFSIEPGLSYAVKGVQLFASVPVAIDRNRPQSVTDMETERLTGQPRRGDAAFADYSINMGISYRINRRSTPARSNVPDFTDQDDSVIETN